MLKVNGRRKFRSQISDLRTDATTVVRRVSNKKESEEKESEKSASVERRSRRVKRLKNCATPRFSNVLGLEGRKIGSLRGGCGAIWLDEKSKRAKHISNAKN